MDASASISDVTSRVAAIQAQLTELQSGALLTSVLGGGADAGTAQAGGASTSFADALSSAQAPTSDTDPADATDLTDLTDSADAVTSAAADGGSVDPMALDMYGGTGGVSLSSGVTLPASAETLLTSGQQQFASTLSAQTGLNPSVVAAWLLAEESGSAAQARQGAGNNDWLNIGYTGSGTAGAGDAIWSDPVTAADATAAWLQGQESIPGYGTASAGVQSILDTVGESPDAQIAALQDSGWSSSGYSDLPSLYDEVAGSGRPTSYA